MNEAVKALQAARLTAAAYRDECKAKKAACEESLEGHDAEIARMTTRIEEIDAAIEKLSGE